MYLYSLEILEITDSDLHIDTGPIYNWIETKTKKNSLLVVTHALLIWEYTINVGERVFYRKFEFLFWSSEMKGVLNWCKQLYKWIMAI